MLCEVARRMGFTEGFDYSGPEQIFDEHARLSVLAARMGRRFDLADFTGMDPLEYQHMPPRQWPAASAGRLFADGNFPTADGRARFIATPARGPRHAPAGEFPLILNTGRTRDQWHTMTRTARAAALNAHEPEPYVDAHLQDLRAAGITPGALARVTSRWGTVLARARSSGEVPTGMLFMPIHWSAQFAAESRVDAVVNPVVDALSGEPEFKHTPVRIEAVQAQWQGFLLARRRVAAPACTWWALSPGEGHHRLEFAGDGAPPDAQWLQESLPELQAADWIEFSDAGAAHYRAALLSGESCRPA